MPTLTEAVENLARTFYELDGGKWEDAPRFVQQAVRTHVRAFLLHESEALAVSEKPETKPPRQD